jgi:Fe2+ or Zn2+ uptake regulation protein
LEDRRLPMPGLREDVIAAICAEEWPHPDHEVNSTTIYERLKRGGVNASKVEVEQVLDQLKEQRDITLVVDPRSGLVVQAVDEELCT